ncbi:metalloproteinase inhibitor 1 isoform X2 [Anolis carolinensis]|uniref:metalloproteinase inhibitor 1 isoform X2 n=1 Tax=Anolis carolinensis TaxID=28377 RepID=UPI002F2B7C7E
MNLAKVSTFLAASFLLLTLLGDTTEACKCYFPHPQTAFCSYDIVLRVKFLRGYGIKTTRVYKGPEEMQNLRDFDTPPRGGACGYSHEGSFREEYLVTDCGMPFRMLHHLQSVCEGRFKNATKSA